MKKKMLGWLSFLMAAVMCFSLAGCGEKAPAAEEEKNQPTESAPVEEQPAAVPQLNEYLATVKVGTVDREQFHTAKGGIYYQENEKYGIMSYVGLHDTGAVYSYLRENGKYFSVSKKEINENAPVSSLNTVSLVTGEGRVLISGYAHYELLDDRYVVASKVTGRASSEKNALLGYEGDLVRRTTVDDYTLFAGSWCLYDLNTAKKVPGISGTKYAELIGYGNLFKWRTENDGVTKTYNSKGEEVVGRVFNNGCYAVEDKIGTVYNSDGVKLFEYALDGYQPFAMEQSETYFIAQKFVNSYVYVLLDKTGKVVSKEFPVHPMVYGELVFIGGKIYNFEGEVVIDGVYDSVRQDPVLENVWWLRSGETYTVMNTKGEVLLRVTQSNSVLVYGSESVITKKVGQDTYVYCHKDKDYTIKGYSFAPWLAKSYNDNYSLCDLVDTITGEVVLDGYRNYSSNAYNDSAYYVYGKYNGGADVYLVVAGSKLAEVEQVKEDLVADLTSAFASEGIDVVVNKETGTMSFGSDILFQADKAELTDQGKKDLQKFLKVYTKIAFSDKYAGFINKTIIEGHIAPDGDSYESGLPLSQKRADVVLNYCLSLGKSDMTGSIQAIGYSNSKPVYNDDGSVNMEKSRRVSFRFMMNIEL